jgi:gas vesicle protein
MFEKKFKISSFLWTFGAGIVTGAAIALVFTPVTGKKFQKKVADTVEDFQSAVRKVANS